MRTKCFQMAARAGAVLGDTALDLDIDSRLCHWYLFIDIILPTALCARGLLSL